MRNERFTCRRKVGMHKGGRLSLFGLHSWGPAMPSVDAALAVRELCSSKRWVRLRATRMRMRRMRTISRWKYSMYLVCKSQHWVQHRDRDGKQTNQELDRCVRVCPSVTRQSCTDISEGGTKALFDIG